MVRLTAFAMLFPSFFGDSSDGQSTRYQRLDSTGSDLETNPRRSIDNSNPLHLDDDNEDDAPLLRRSCEKKRESTTTTRRRGGGGLRRSRCFFALAFVLLISSISFVSFLLITFINRGDNANERPGFDYYPASQDQKKGSYSPCDNCSSYSALPEHILPLQSSSLLTESGLDSWVGTGVLPLNSSLNLSSLARLDGIAFWVNGSDPRHRSARMRFSADINQVDYPPNSLSLSSTVSSLLGKRNSNSTTTTTTTTTFLQSRILNKLWSLQNDDKRFREQNELLYNLRSAKQSLNDNLGTLHIISTDYWDQGSKYQVPGIQDRLFQGRRGQVPQWLNMSSEDVAFGSEKEDKVVALRMHHDWETFVPLVKTKENLLTWKVKRLPSFDSIAAEAVLGLRLPGLAENSFLASDDMFLGQRLTTADFYTPLYGSVLHLDMHNLIRPSEKPWSLGEMVGLRWSASLLHNRFGTRLFPYPTHVHKSISKPLLLESKMMWKEEFEEATFHRFRADGKLANSHILLNGLIVERHREALLWSFLVAKIDRDGNGVLSDEELERTYTLMGAATESGSISGRMRVRRTIEKKNIKNNLQAVSFPTPIASTYAFSSLDGFPFVSPLHAFTEATGLRLRDGPLNYLAEIEKDDKKQRRFENDICQVSLQVCWPKDFTSKAKSRLTTEIFTRFAFQEPSCGDCLIIHLVNQSGSNGLDAFLPFDDDIDDDLLPYPNSDSTIPKQVPAHLPLGKDWTSIDFSLKSVASINRIGWKKRQFCNQLFHRYNYVIANAPASFDQLTSPSSASITFAKLERGKTAFICLNDDIRWRLDKVRVMLQTFFEGMWPTSTTRLPFEKWP